MHENTENSHTPIMYQKENHAFEMHSISFKIQYILKRLRDNEFGTGHY